MLRLVSMAFVNCSSSLRNHTTLEYHGVPDLSIYIAFAGSALFDAISVSHLFAKLGWLIKVYKGGTLHVVTLFRSDV